MLHDATHPEGNVYWSSVVVSLFRCTCVGTSNKTCRSANPILSCNISRCKSSSLICWGWLSGSIYSSIIAILYHKLDVELLVTGRTAVSCRTQINVDLLSWEPGSATLFWYLIAYASDVCWLSRYLNREHVPGLVYDHMYASREYWIVQRQFATADPIPNILSSIFADPYSMHCTIFRRERITWNLLWYSSRKMCLTHPALDGATSPAQVHPQRARQTIDWSYQSWRIREDARSPPEEDE